MIKNEDIRAGMPITRVVNGKYTRMDRLPEKIVRRIEQIGKLNDKRKAFVTSANWEGLLKLADEYEHLFMNTMAMEIRKEAVEHGAYTFSPYPRGVRPKKAGSDPKTARRVDTGTVRRIRKST